MHGRAPHAHTRRALIRSLPVCARCSAAHGSHAAAVCVCVPCARCRWTGLGATPSGLQYRVKGLCSVESRSNASSGGPSVQLAPGGRGLRLGSGLLLPHSPSPIEPPALLSRAANRGSSFRLQLSSRS